MITHISAMKNNEEKSKNKTDNLFECIIKKLNDLSLQHQTNFEKIEEKINKLDERVEKIEKSITFIQETSYCPNCKSYSQEKSFKDTIEQLCIPCTQFWLSISKDNKTLDSMKNDIIIKTMNSFKIHFKSLDLKENLPTEKIDIYQNKIENFCKYLSFFFKKNFDLLYNNKQLNNLCSDILNICKQLDESKLSNYRKAIVTKMVLEVFHDIYTCGINPINYLNNDQIYTYLSLVLKYYISTHDIEIKHFTNKCINYDKYIMLWIFKNTLFKKLPLNIKKLITSNTYSKEDFKQLCFYKPNNKQTLFNQTHLFDHFK